MLVLEARREQKKTQPHMTLAPIVELAPHWSGRRARGLHHCAIPAPRNRQEDIHRAL